MTNSLRGETSLCSFFIYIGLAILLILFVLGMFLRRGIYKDVDKLEEWKNKLLNQSIPEEIAKVKKLQMAGETEEKFELWRNDWDEIAGVILPDIEENLFDIEEYANKYRFRKAKEIVTLAEKRMKGIEDQLEVMVAEIQELVNSEAKNRNEITEVEASYRQLQSELLKKTRLVR